MGTAWEEGKPIYKRLPGDNEGYQRDQEWEGYEPELDVAYWLTKPWDDLLIETKQKIDDFYTNYLNPATAQPEYLDWLAQLCGFSGNYWDSQWPIAVKRSLLSNSYNFIWPNKGTRELFEWLFGVFVLEASVLVIGDFLFDVTLLDAPIGGGNLKYYIVTKLVYLRTSPEWALLEKLNELFGPVFCESRVIYEQFYFDFSVCGDLILS